MNRFLSALAAAARLLLPQLSFSPRHVPPALRRLGVKLSAEDIATAVWLQTRQSQVHRPIHWLFKLMYWSGQVSPVWLNRLIMQRLSRA